MNKLEINASYANVNVIAEGNVALIIGISFAFILTAITLFYITRKKIK